MDNNYNRKPSNNSDRLSWILIALLFLGGEWPLAILWATIKLMTGKPQPQRRQAPPLHEETYQQAQKVQQKKKPSVTLRERIEKLKESPMLPYIVAVFGAALAAIGLIMFVDDLAVMTLFRGLYDLAIAAAGVGIFGNGFNSILVKKRYPKYAAIIGTRQAMSIEDIAKKTGYSEKRVVSDLQKLLDKGLFGNTAYINMELGYIFMSSEADEDLTAARAHAMEKMREASQKEGAKQEPDVYEATIARIRDLNDRIDNEAVSRKIERLEQITREIFKAVQEDPTKVAKIDRFMSYYLPSTLKILESYEKLEEANVDGGNISKGMKSIEDTMDSIVLGFEKQLDKLYMMDTLDLETDLDVMTQMLERDSGTNNDFKPQASAGGSAAAVEKK